MEVTKNLILNGVGEIVILLKSSEQTFMDITFLKMMNPKVKIDIDLSADDILEKNYLLKDFDYVILLNQCDTERVFEITSLCRNNDIPVSWALSLGCMSFFINDWGNYVYLHETKYFLIFFV